MLFACRLAMALGVLDPLELLNTMPLKTWRLWEEYAAVEPWRIEDEPGRLYAFPGPEELAAKLSAGLGANQHAKR